LSIVGVLADGFMVDGARTSTAMEMVLTTPGTNDLTWSTLLAAKERR